MYGQLDAEGRLVKHFPLPVEYRSMYHDFAITEHYTVIAQMPLVFDPKVGAQRAIPRMAVVWVWMRHVKTTEFD
jgi:carotenoid cleavage dioxygenase